MRVTDAEIARLEALEKKATAGPWEAGMACDGTLIVMTSSARYLALISAGDSFPDDAANQHLIAATRNALPDLLSEVRRLRAERERLREACRASLEYLESLRASGGLKIDATLADLRAALAEEPSP